MGTLELFSLSDSEENITISPYAKTPRTRPRARTTTPVAGNVVCLDSDEDSQAQVGRPTAPRNAAKLDSVTVAEASPFRGGPMQDCLILDDGWSSTMFTSPASQKGTEPVRGHREASRADTVTPTCNEDPVESGSCKRDNLSRIEVQKSTPGHGSGNPGSAGVFAARMQGLSVESQLGSCPSGGSSEHPSTSGHDAVEPEKEPACVSRRACGGPIAEAVCDRVGERVLGPDVLHSGTGSRSSCAGGDVCGETVIDLDAVDVRGNQATHSMKRGAEAAKAKNVEMAGSLPLRALKAAAAPSSVATPKMVVIDLDSEEIPGSEKTRGAKVRGSGATDPWPDLSWICSPTTAYRTTKRLPVEIFSTKDLLSRIPCDSSPEYGDPWTGRAGPCESQDDVERTASKRRKPAHTSAAESPPHNAPPPCGSLLETGHASGGEDPCGGSQRKRGAGQRVTSEEERMEKLRATEVELARKLAERDEKKRQKEAAKKQQQEEVRRRKEEEKVRKEAAKLEARERRKAEHEVERWARGKFAVQNTTALVDTKVLETGLVGGHLLRRFSEKQLQYQLVSNPIPKSILWRTKRPTADCLESFRFQCWDPEDLESRGEGLGSQLVLEEAEIPYILFILEAEEFSTMVAENTLASHIREAQRCHPGSTICYLVNKLMWFLQKKDQAQFEHGDSGWCRPRVEQALAGLTVNFMGVRSRLCVDEADVADHVTGLMRSLAEYGHKPKLTALSVSKNGEHVQKNDAFKEEIKKNLWLKALVAVPKVSGPCAMAIAKAYPNMRALLKAYLDTNKTVPEKELLLQDLVRESVFGSEGAQRIGPACSRRIYRILMAQDGNLKVDKVEHGAPPN